MPRAATCATETRSEPATPLDSGSRRRLGFALTGLLAWTAIGCASVGPLPNQRGDIHQIKKIVDPSAVRDSTARETRFVRVVRREAFGVLDSLAARQRMPLEWTDSLLLASQWRTRLRVTPDSAGPWEWGVLLPELQTARGEAVLGPPAGPEGGLYSLWRDSAGTGLDLYRGALVFKDWGTRGGGVICVRVAGACLGTSNASYAVRSTQDGGGELFVGAGQVTVTREGDWNPDCVEVANRPLAVSCGDPGRRTIVGDGTLLTWGVTTVFSAQRVSDPEEVRRLRDAIQYNGEDLWEDDRFPWPLLLAIPAAVGLCLATDILFCGDDDLSARVRLVP